jgi:hypothetical protein
MQTKPTTPSGKTIMDLIHITTSKTGEYSLWYSPYNKSFYSAKDGILSLGGTSLMRWERWFGNLTREESNKIPV